MSFNRYSHCYTNSIKLLLLLCWLKYFTIALLSILIASYYSIERLALTNFSYAQQDHKLNETAIIGLTVHHTILKNALFPLVLLPLYTLITSSLLKIRLGKNVEYDLSPQWG